MNERIKRLKYKDNCYVVASFKKRDNRYGEFVVEPVVSFLYVDGDNAVEWECSYGPIQRFKKVDEGTEGAIKHHVFDWVESDMDWSQMAVERHELPQAANRGDFDYIFAILKDWCE